jgi:hypothetical protein
MVTKPTIGQDPWGETLNAALDELAANVATKETTGAAAGAVAAHEAATDPHPAYAVESDVSASLAGKSDTGHTHSYEPAGTAAAAVSAHEGAADPHPGYVTDGDLSSGLAGKAASSHVHAGSEITSGTVPFARLPVGTTSTTVAQGDHVHAGGSAVGVVLTGTGAPSGGSDGDWYVRSDSPGALYRKVSGAWTLWGRASSLYQQNPSLRSAPWTASYVGAWLNTSTATAAQAFPNASTGVTKTGTSCVLSNASAAGTIVGGYGAAMSCSVAAMPGAGQTIRFGLGGFFYGNLYPYVSVNSSGVAVLTNGGTTLKTFSGTVAAGVNNAFIFALTPGALLVCQTTASGVILDQALYAADYVQAALGANTGWIAGGYGTLSFAALEVYG